MLMKRFLDEPWPKLVPRAMSIGDLPMRRIREWGPAPAEQNCSFYSSSSFGCKAGAAPGPTQPALAEHVAIWFLMAT